MKCIIILEQFKTVWCWHSSWMKDQGIFQDPGWGPGTVVYSSFFRHPENSQKCLWPLEGISMGALSTLISTLTRIALLLCILYIGFPHLFGITSQRVSIALILIYGRGWLINRDWLMKQIIVGNLIYRWWGLSQCFTLLQNDIDELKSKTIKILEKYL